MKLTLPRYQWHKGSHITQVMFLCALTRPRFNYTTRQWFDSLVGFYPVGELDMYDQTSSIHRLGDIKLTNVNMDRDLYRKMFVDLILPDIKKKILVNTNMILQQEGMKSHLQEDDELFIAKVTEMFGDPNAVNCILNHHSLQI
jgi:hypothetical protein